MNRIAVSGRTITGNGERVSANSRQEGSGDESMFNLSLDVSGKTASRTKRRRMIACVVEGTDEGRGELLGAVIPWEIEVHSEPPSV